MIENAETLGSLELERLGISNETKSAFTGQALAGASGSASERFAQGLTVHDYA
jgi:hypothetical protein